MKELDKLIKQTELKLKKHKKELKTYIKQLKQTDFNGNEILECTFSDEMKIVSLESYLQGLIDAKKLLSKKC